MNTVKCYYCWEREQSEILLLYCHSVLQVLARGFLQKISHFDGKEWPIKAGKLLSIIGHIGNKARMSSMSLL